MITQMKKYTFLVFHREYEAFLEQLREEGVVHITEKAAGMAEDAHLQELFAKADATRKLIAQPTASFASSHGLVSSSVNGRFVSWYFTRIVSALYITIEVTPIRNSSILDVASVRLLRSPSTNLVIDSSYA